MSTLRKAAQQALEALELAQTDVHWELNSPTRKFLRKAEKTLRAALAQQDESVEPVREPVAWIHTDLDKPRVKFLEWSEDAPGYRGRWIKTPLYAAPPRCPNCASLEAQNTELDRKLAELEQAYEAGYKAGQANEREECAKLCEARFVGDLTREDMEARRCAAAIRARGEQP